MEAPWATEISLGLEPGSTHGLLSQRFSALATCYNHLAGFEHSFNRFVVEPRPLRFLNLSR